MGGSGKDACNLTSFWTKEYDNDVGIVPWSNATFEFPNCCQRWNVEITIGIIAFAKNVNETRK